VEEPSAKCSLTIGRQCELIGVARSTYYYYSKSDPEKDEPLRQAILKIYEKCPFYGVRRMNAALKRAGFRVGERHVRTLLRSMGLHAIELKKNLSKPSKEHIKYPYLLRGVEVTRVNQVWSSDITYIKLDGGFVYLVAVIDWFSRMILSWELSNTLDVNFCVEALKDAAAVNGAPEIFNVDQGSQFTSEAFRKAVMSLGAQLSMDGKGRALDNVFIERFWKSIKYEDILLKDYESVKALRKGIENYIHFYNSERLHQSLNYCTPEEIYEKGRISKSA